MTVEPKGGSPKPSRISLPGTNFHRLRKTVHILCFAVFVFLPLSNVMRADIPRQRFYFFGTELWINEFGIIFLSLMFLLFVVAAMAMIYGRFYCSYLCPQMIFSEASLDLEARIRHWVNKRVSTPRLRSTIVRAVLYAILLPVSVFLAFIFISYFVEPRDLLHRLMSFDIRTAGGIAGASTTLLTFLDFAFLRLKFCTTVCPYGYLQGILADDNTLLVHYRDQTNSCIRCNKCVKVCPMGIDIRDSAHQIECTHCADCVDACSAVLGKLGRPTLIHYAWGETGETLQGEKAWYKRIGIRDFKRVAVLVVMLLYASGLYVAVAMRQPVLVRISADRSVLYTVQKDGKISNRFRLEVSNRGQRPVGVAIAVEGLSDSSFAGAPDLTAVQPGASVRGEFEILVPPEKAAPGVTHIRLQATTLPGGNRQEFPMTFIAPTEDERSKTGGEGQSK